MTKKQTNPPKKKAKTAQNPEAEIIEIAPREEDGAEPVAPETTEGALPGKDLSDILEMDETAEAIEEILQEPDDFEDADQADLGAVIEPAPVGADRAEEEPQSLESEIEEETASIEEMPDAELYRTPAALKAAIECLLFTTPHPLSLKKIRSLLGSCDLKTLRGAISQLQMEYDARIGGLQIIEGVEGYQMCTRPQFAEVILRLHQQRKRNPLTMTALETLAIVAYKQPITRAEIEMIRGVESSGVLRNLCDMGVVKVVGRKEVIGRPQLYGTTSVFLQTFGLRSLSELPSIEVLRRQMETRSSLQTAAEPPFETGEQILDATVEENSTEEETEDAWEDEDEKEEFDEDFSESEEEEEQDDGEEDEIWEEDEENDENREDDEDWDEDDEDWEMDDEDEENEDDDTR